MIEVNGALIAHRWESSTSRWIQEAAQSPMMVPSHVQLSLASNDAASSVTPNTSLAANGMNPQSGNVARDSLDAAARDAKLAAAWRMIYFSNKANGIPIVIDTGASMSMSPCREDFIDLKETKGSLVALAGDASTEGVGKWSVGQYTMSLVLYGPLRRCEPTLFQQQ
jgi:hypothetical protein